MRTPSSAPSGSDPCPKVGSLQAFVRGDLSQEDTERIAEHLQYCSQCSSMVLTFPDLNEGPLQEYSRNDASPEAPATLAVDPTRGPSRSDSPTAPPPGRSPRLLRIGRYLIRRRLGKGGFGIVYLCHDEELDRLVALKVPHARGLQSPEKLRVYREEARRHAALDHPHIVPIYDVGGTDTVPVFQVSKFIDGENLAERIKRRLLPPQEAATLVLRLAEALEHMHRRNLVHRDVKPRNILLDREGVPFLTDFGLAFRPDAAEELDEFGMGGVAGTPAYMSPEQCAADYAAIDGRTDIFSLGIVLYESLTGVRPFQGERDDVRRRILAENPPPLRRVDPGIPPDLEKICAKALAKVPADRYARAGELAEDLEDFLGGLPPRHAVPTGPAGRLLLVLKRRRNQLGGVLLLALISAALALFFFRSAPPAPPRLPVSVATVPPGADVSFFPLDENTGRPRPDLVVRTRAGRPALLTPGYHLVVAVRKNPAGDVESFHEVQRWVPPAPSATGAAHHHDRWEVVEGGIRLESIRLHPAEVPAGMCRFAGAAAIPSGADTPPGPGKGPLLTPPAVLSIPPFHLDVAEVTKDAFHRFRDTYEYPAEEKDHPATRVSWEDAAAFAEFRGKRLPDEYEYEFAATAGGTRRFPWGNDPAEGKWSLGPVAAAGHDRLELPGLPPVFGLYSNAAEWTASCPARSPLLTDAVPRHKMRIVRGGPPAMIERGESSGPTLGPAERYSYAVPLLKPGLGFRCARSVRPRWNPEDFVQVLRK